MIYVLTVILLWIQALLMEVADSTGLLCRLWLLPIVALSFRSSQIRILPVLIIGLLTDGLMAAPTGVHVLEVSLIYGVLMASAKQLSDQTVLTRALIGCLITVADIFIMTAIEWLMPHKIESNFLMLNFFTFLLCQVMLIVCVLPIVSSLHTSQRRSEFRLRNEVDRS